MRLVGDGYHVCCDIIRLEQACVPSLWHMRACPVGHGSPDLKGACRSTIRPASVLQSVDDGSCEWLRQESTLLVQFPMLQPVGLKFITEVLWSKQRWVALIATSAAARRAGESGL